VHTPFERLLHPVHALFPALTLYNVERRFLAEVKVLKGTAVMAEANNVFISWSGPRSKSAAEALKDWLPNIVQTARPWMSATDIEKGTRWREEVAAALDTMKAGIICLAPENLAADWLLFEAGALSKIRDQQTRVWTYLLADLKPQHLKDPLAMFQATTAEKEDTRKLIHSINKNLDAIVAESRLNHLFDKLWPDLEQKLSALPSPPGAMPPKRSSDEIAADTLELVRAVAPLIQDIASETEVARRNRLLNEKLHDALTRSGSVINLSSLPLSTSGSLAEYARNADILLRPRDSQSETAESISPPTPHVPRRRTHAPSRRRKPRPSGGS
jgi:TIR domain